MERRRRRVRRNEEVGNLNSIGVEVGTLERETIVGFTRVHLKFIIIVR